MLNNQSTYYAIIRINKNNNNNNTNLFAYTTKGRYTLNLFYNIIIDIRALNLLTTRYKQYLAYKKDNSIDIDILKEGAINV